MIMCHPIKFFRIKNNDMLDLNKKCCSPFVITLNKEIVTNIKNAWNAPQYRPKENLFVEYTN